MYAEMTLEQIATEAKRHAEVSRDVVANSAGVRMEKHSSGFYLVSRQPTHPLAAVMNEVAADQLAARFGIPTRYFEKCRNVDAGADINVTTEGSIACQNANFWMQQDPKDVMIRTLDSGDGDAVARAVLSNRYLRLDNHEVLNTFFGGMANRPADLGRVGVLGGSITDKRMYLNLLFEGTEFDLADEGERADPHHLGVCLTNSEVGYGAVGVYAFLYRSYCQNGLVFGKRDLMGFERRHVGQVRGHGELSPETHEHIRKAIISACTDVARVIADRERREKLVAPLRLAKQSARIEHAEPAFEELARTVGLTDAERSKALEHFIREQDYSKFGAAQAVTWLANEDRGGERVQQLMEIGGDIVSLSSSGWKRIAEAA